MKSLLVILGVFLLFFLAIFWQDIPAKFKVGECVKNEQFYQVKKIIDSRMFTYKYCIFGKKGECAKMYILRKSWFNLNHKKVNCPMTEGK